jgi:hypothetical protein
MIKRIHTAGLALAFVLGASAAWAKLPPPPPLDEKGKAAAEEKKAQAAANAAKAKAELAAAEDRAVQSYQANMKRLGKPIAKPVPIAAAAAPAPGAAPTPAGKAPETAPVKPAEKKS